MWGKVIGIILVYLIGSSREGETQSHSELRSFLFTFFPFPAVHSWWDESWGEGDAICCPGSSIMTGAKVSTLFKVFPRLMRWGESLMVKIQDIFLPLDGYYLLHSTLSISSSPMPWGQQSLLLFPQRLNTLFYREEN